MPEQPWDTAKVATAFADASEIVEALGSDSSGDKYRAALGRLMELRLDDAEDVDDLSNRLAYVLYGCSLYSLGALTVAEAYSGLPRDEVTAKIGAALDHWLG